MAVALPGARHVQGGDPSRSRHPDGLTEEERTQVVVRDRVSRTLGMFNRQRNIQLDSALARWNMDLFTVVDNARTSRPVPPATRGRAALESELSPTSELPKGLTVDEKVDRLLDRLDTLTLNDGRPAVAGIIDGLLDTQNGSWADSSQSNQATALQFAALDLQGPDVLRRVQLVEEVVRQAGRGTTTITRASPPGR